MYAPPQSGEVFDRSIGQRGGVQMVPEQFHRIQLGGVRRQPFDAQSSSVPGQGVPHQPAAAGGQTIHQQQNGKAAVASQRVQEAHHLSTPNAALVQGQQPAGTATVGLGENRGDAGQGLPVEGFDQLGRLSPWRPGGPNRSALSEAAFVQKPQPDVQALGVFFTCGQRTRTQRATAFSSRSLARRAGRWRLQPSCRSSRQVCARE